MGDQMLLLPNSQVSRCGSFAIVVTILDQERSVVFAERLDGRH